MLIFSRMLVRKEPAMGDQFRLSRSQS